MGDRALKALSETEAMTVIRNHLKKGNVLIGKHFRDQLDARRITMQDVVHALTGGVIRKPPERDVTTGQWKYAVDGLSVDDEPLTIVVAIIDEYSSYFVTVFLRT